MGRDPQCDLRLSRATVSAMHCLLIKRDRRLLVRDLNSLNGTRVNGQRVSGKFLSTDDVLDLGGARFRVAVDDGCRSGASAVNTHRKKEVNPRR